MTVQAEVNALLSEDTAFTGIVSADAIYSDISPLVEKDDAPFALITCISNPKSAFASNRSIAEQNNVQVQVWLPLDSDQTDAVLTAVDAVMEVNHFYQYYEFDSKDPTIDLYQITMQYRRHKVY